MTKPIEFYCDHPVARVLASMFGSQLEKLTANEKYRLLGLLGIFASVRMDEYLAGLNIHLYDIEWLAGWHLDIHAIGHSTENVKSFLKEMFACGEEEEFFEARILRPIILAIANMLDENTCCAESTELTPIDSGL